MIGTVPSLQYWTISTKYCPFFLASCGNGLAFVQRINTHASFGKHIWIKEGPISNPIFVNASHRSFANATQVLLHKSWQSIEDEDYENLIKDSSCVWQNYNLDLQFIKMGCFKVGWALKSARDLIWRSGSHWWEARNWDPLAALFGW